MTVLADKDFERDTTVATAIATNTPAETVVEVPLDVLAHLIACAEDQRLADLRDQADEPRFDRNQSHALDVAWVWFVAQAGKDSINAVCRFLTLLDPEATELLKTQFDRIGLTRPDPDIDALIEAAL